MRSASDNRTYFPRNQWDKLPLTDRDEIQQSLVGAVSAEEARKLLDPMRVDDCFEPRERLWPILHEKGGKRHEVPCHPSLRVSLEVYIRAANITGNKKAWLFRSIHRGDKPTDKPMTRFDGHSEDLIIGSDLIECRRPVSR